VISRPESHSPSNPDVAIVGAGIIGLAVARRLALGGLRVAVIERGRPAQEATQAAAGMLCPRLEYGGETELDPQSVAALGLTSLSLYPEFAASLEDETNIDVDLRLNGVISPEDSDANSPKEGEGYRVISREEACEIVPGLHPDLEAIRFYPEEGSVDNRRVAAALIESCRRLGVDIRCDCGVRSVLTSTSRVCGLETERGTIETRLVVNTAGAWASEISGSGSSIEIRPIKGQMLCLEQGTSPQERVEHTIYSHHAYIVPRSDGRIVIGTTVEDRGFDKSVDDEAVAGLRDGAARMVPTLARARLQDAWAGLRPLGVDERPVIGPAGHDGHFVAVGHYRNGILLTPVTAELLAAEILRTN